MKKSSEVGEHESKTLKKKGLTCERKIIVLILSSQINKKKPPKKGKARKKRDFIRKP